MAEIHTFNGTIETPPMTSFELSLLSPGSGLEDRSADYSQGIFTEDLSIERVAAYIRNRNRSFDDSVQLVESQA